MIVVVVRERKEDVEEPDRICPNLFTYMYCLRARAGLVPCMCMCELPERVHEARVKESVDS